MSLKIVLLCLMASILMVNGDVPSNCLGCLCEASTLNCNLAEKCHTAGSYFCGPFLINWNYWAVAGKPLNTFTNPDALGAFEDCVQNVNCAIRTINSYMALHAKDCDGDGAVTCEDFVRIHKHGQNACQRPLTGDFGQKYHACANKVIGG